MADAFSNAFALMRLHACLPSRTFCDKRKFMDILDRELFRAVSEGNLNGVREALRRGADVDARDEDMRTPLFYVAEADVSERQIAKWIEIGEELLRAGADLEARDYEMMTPLIAATDGSSISMMRWLLEKGADVNAVSDCSLSALHYAVFDPSEPERVELLLEYGAPLNLRGKDVADHETVYDLAYGEVLAEPSKMGKKTLYLLRKHGAVSGCIMEPVCTQENTPEACLLVAIDEGDTEKFMDALEKGADVDAVSGSWLKLSALMKAAHFGRLAMVKELLDRGADTTLRDSEGHDALRYSIYSDNPELIRLLMKRYAGSLRERRELVSIAAVNGCEEAMLVLLQAGIPPNFLNEYDETPLDVARLCSIPGTGYEKVISLLLQHGAMTADQFKAKKRGRTNKK